MALLNVTSGLGGIQKQLGINGWQLAQGKFTVPTQQGASNTTASQTNKLLTQAGVPIEEQNSDTITFLDVETLVGQYGFDLNTQAIPVAEFAENLASFFTEGGDNANNSGDTFYINQKDDWSNQLVTYDVPDAPPIIQGWGRNVTRFTCTILLANQDYLDKLRLLRDIFTRNLGEGGGVLDHPLYGTYENVFVEKFSTTSQSAPHNGSYVMVQFVTGQQPYFNQDKKNWVEEANKWLNRANYALTVVGSLSNLDDQVRSVLPDFGIDLTNSSVEYTANSISVVEQNSSTSYSGVTIPTSALSPQLSSAIRESQELGIPADTDIEQLSYTVLEQASQKGNVQFQGFGQGGLSSSVVSTLTTEEPLTYTDTTSENVDGTITTTVYQTTDVDEEGVYTVRKTVTTFTPVNTPSTNALQNSINDVISYTGILSRVNTEYYSYYIMLLAGIKNYTNLVLSKDNVITLETPENILPTLASARAGMDFQSFWELNKQNMKGHTVMYQGFSIEVDRNA